MTDVRTRRGVRHLLAGAVTAVVLASAAPAGALVDDPISVPPDLGDAPAGERYLDPEFSFSQTHADVAYGEAVNARGETQTLVLDVWQPEEDDEEQFRPAVVWVHGGFFTEGSKAGIDFLHELTRRGYVTVSINYRLRPDMARGWEEILLTPEVGDNLEEVVDATRDAQHDAQAAVRWVRANAAELRVDPTRVVIAGHSAGAITGLRVAFNRDGPGHSGNPDWPSHVAAAISSAGGHVSGLLGTIEPGDPPIKVLHGTHDQIVPIAANLVPCANTRALGNVCDARIYPEAEHNNMPRDDRGAASAEFLFRHVISAERIQTEFTEVTTTTRGESVTVTGRLVADDPRPVVGGTEPVADARVLVRSATGDWSETTTDAHGVFTATIDAPDHGRAIELELRYEGHSTGSWLDAPHTAPTHTTATATWGGGSTTTP